MLTLLSDRLLTGVNIILRLGKIKNDIPFTKEISAVINKPL